MSCFYVNLSPSTYEEKEKTTDEKTFGRVRNELLLIKLEGMNLSTCLFDVYFEWI